ncbi:MAG: hypothetical protein WC679_00600 [Bacteroidales bacterium]|jgi:hypothetical protein
MLNFDDYLNEQTNPSDMDSLIKCFTVLKKDFDGKKYSLSLYDNEDDTTTNDARKSSMPERRMEFPDKKEANKFFRAILKKGLIEKRGYDYFVVGNRSLEIRQNY